jgi:dTDP-4-amino-4,6-dideoxygalactose transaminase
MPGWKVPVADLHITEEDIAVVADVYRSGWLSMGRRTAEFEEALAGYAGARHAVAVSSGTAALHLSCAAVGLGPGDDVIVPSLTFVATVNAIAYTGARPVFADLASVSEPWLSVERVQAALTPATRAVLNVSYGGHSGDIERLSSFCAERGLLLLEDAAHSLGSRLSGRHLGTFGIAGAFSFFANKNLAVGEGGAIVTDDAELAERVRLLRSHGLTSLSWERSQPGTPDYDVIARGFNYRIDEPRAALGKARLARVDHENAARALLDDRYRRELDGMGLECLLAPGPALRAAHHLFCVLCEGAADRDAFRQGLSAQGIQTSLHYPPVHRLSIYSEPRFDLPVTDEYANRSVTLPMYAHMTEREQDLVFDAVRSTLAGRAESR